METDIPVPRALLSTARIGAIVTVRNDDDREYRGRLIRIEGETALVRTFDELDFPTESHLGITLIQAIPGREKMALIVQKATELGVARIVPCTTSRSVLSGHPGEGQDKSHRWPVVARKAVEQCRRRVAPIVSACFVFSETIDLFSAETGLKLILYEKEKATRLKDLASTGERPDELVIACGPEGGFTDEEVLLARENGFVPIRFGGRTLRCETAALAALSIVQYEWGDLG